MSLLEEQLKELIIESLNLEDITVDDINTDDPLFGDGLGLDSIDALELGLALQKKYGTKINAEDKNTKAYFQSISSLADFINNNRN